MTVDMINHPPHYNNHPSGVEAIEITRLLNFNLGNCFKYVFRRNDKGNAAQDLGKAIWYLEDHTEFDFLDHGVFDNFTNEDFHKIDKIWAVEKGVEIQAFYECFVIAEWGHCLKHLRRALDNVK